MTNFKGLINLVLLT